MYELNLPAGVTIHWDCLFGTLMAMHVAAISLCILSLLQPTRQDCDESTVQRLTADGYAKWSDTEKYYKYHTSAKNQPKAKFECQTAGARLAVFTSQADLDAAKHYYQRKTMVLNCYLYIISIWIKYKQKMAPQTCGWAWWTHLTRLAAEHILAAEVIPATATEKFNGTMGPPRLLLWRYVLAINRFYCAKLIMSGYLTRTSMPTRVTTACAWSPTRAKWETSFATLPTHSSASMTARTQ